jgi:hypothetical protein
LIKVISLPNESLYASLKIHSLIEVPEIRTVIQLEDLKNPNLREMIIETFVITSEVLSNLQAVLASLTGSEGRGIFLKGHFGSGKSHFLSMLSVLLKSPRAWDTVLSQAPSLKEFKQRLTNLRFLVVERSLVQHRGSEFLEDIILRAVLETLEDDTLQELNDTETRHKTFSKLKVVLKGKGFSGLVILVDELSEFLRSKTDARAYNEDIRFLQYLGEEAVSFPLWIIASLQEWIEETGEIHQDTFNKIKDRYRIRLNLGRAHIEELISERLIRHKQGADSIIGLIFDDLKAFFPTFPVTRERFIRLYPVHPATSSLLDLLKPLFSEHRGVVDFIHFRLKGDPERQIPSMMDTPSRRLLTPEVIFDHFLDRIRERAETQVYVQRVFESCEVEINRLFPDPDQQAVALSTIKILILFAISPIQYKYTVRHIAEMILFQVTSLESEINYQYLRDILDQLEKEGLYIRVEHRDNPLDDYYYIDLKADTAGIIRRRIRHNASQLFSEDQRLFWKTAALADSSYLPLGDWVAKGRQPVTVRWQHTQRIGTLLLRQLDEFTIDEAEGLAKQEERTEEDFFILVGTTHNREEEYRHVKELLLPHIRNHFRGRFLFWIPALQKDDITWLKELLAEILMGEEMGQFSDTNGPEEKKILQTFVNGGKKRLAEHFDHHYYQGLLLWDENEVDLSRIGFLTQEKFLSEFVPPLLERRFPRHSRIQPYISAPAPGILNDMLRDFLFSGILVVEDRSKFGLREILDNLLRPMGLVRNKGNRYELHVNPRQNELARAFFTAMAGRETVPLDEMYWNLRKSEYGLLMPHFEILTLSLLFSGHLMAYKVMNRKSPDEIARTGLKGVTALGRGEIISEECLQVIATHPLIPKPFRNVPITLASQEDLWSEMKSQKLAAIEDLASLKSRIQWASAFEAFKNMPWEGVRNDIDDLTSQWDEIKVSLTSKEGLERFIRAVHREPFLEDKLKSIQASGRFLEQAERALFVYQYITDQRLHVPKHDPYTLGTQDPEGGIREGDALGDYDRLLRDKADILSFFNEKPEVFSTDVLAVLFNKFQNFQESYIKTYVEAHDRARGSKRFEPYEKVSQSRRFHILQRLGQLEMISVEHNHRSINQALTSVLANRCLRSPQDHLQGGPICTCGFHLGESTPFTPLKNIEDSIEQGILETLEALHTPSIQEKIIPYMEGLDLVNRKDEADAIRLLLKLEETEKDFLNRLDQALTAQVIWNVNEAFRGKVVVVKRNLDLLYQSLIHRKYTLTQLRKILRDWLKEETIGDDTFLHFVGKGEGYSIDQTKEDFRAFLEREYGHMKPLYQELGHDLFIKFMITTLWAKVYNLPHQKMQKIFPFLEQRPEEENIQRFMHLDKLASALCTNNRALFESLVFEIEQDPSFIKTLWSSLSSLSPAAIFTNESIFSGILKEAFERVFSGKLNKSKMNELIGPFESVVSCKDSRCMQRRDEMVNILKTYYLFSSKLSIIETLKDLMPNTFEKWESLYVQTIAPIPFLKEMLYDGLKRIGTPVPPFLKEEGKETDLTLQEMSTHFAGFYGPALNDWETSGSPRPMMIQDIPYILTRKRNVPDHQKVCFMLMDGMRWDLWEYIKSNFFGKKPNLFRFVREGALWANQPTNTGPQLTRFEEALRSAHPDSDSECFWKISPIDEKIHSEKGPLTHLFANIVQYLEVDLLFRLQDLPSRTLLVIFADHGFMENPAFSYKAKYDTARYTHGKYSPFEVIVPWAWMMRI